MTSLNMRNKKNILLALLVGIIIIISVAADSQSFCLSQKAMQTNAQRIYYNGNPFFPLGFYYVEHNNPNQKSVLQGQLQAINDIASAGFNVMQASVNSYLSDFQTLLEQAQSVGVTLMVIDFDPVTAVPALKSYPALLGWTIGDDVNKNYTPNALAQLDAQIKALDPIHPTYITMYDPNPQVIEKYIHLANWVGMETYPIPSKSVVEVCHAINSAVSTSLATGGSSIIANLQTFAWSSTQRPPTTIEVRNMTYQALLEGVRGILYYTYKDSSNYLPNNTELWSGIKTIAQEVKSLEPWLLGSNFRMTNITQNNSQILSSMWQVNNQKLLLVLNISTESQNVSINLPSSIRQLGSFFNTQQPSLSLKNGALTGSLKPLDIQVYQVS